MKTQIRLNRKKRIHNLALACIAALFLLSINGYAQTSETASNQNQGIMVEGIVTNEDGPLGGTNIILEGSNTGVVADIDGKFSFPKALNPGDVLIFSYLGYEPQKITISDKTKFIRMELTLDSVTIIEALNTEVPFSSKKNN